MAIKMRGLFWMVSSAFCLLGGAAQALPTFFTDRTAFTASAGPLGEERFETAFVPIATRSFAGFDLGVEDGSLVSIADPGFVSEGARAVSDGAPSSQRFLFAFDQPVFAFGLDIIGFGDVAAPHALTASTGDGQLTGYEIDSVPPQNASETVQFWGVVSSSSFSTLTLDTGVGGDRVGLDFAVFSTEPSSSAVPVPAALPLLGSALAALAFAHRRRRADA